MSECAKIWFVLGAGVSAGPPSSLSLWGEISRDTRQFLYRTVEHKIRATGGEGYLPAKEALDRIEGEAYPETVLECLSRVYGRTSVSQSLRSLLSPPDSVPNACHRAVAQLCKQGHVGGILTTNFDTLLEEALDEEGVAYRAISKPRIQHEDFLPLIKIHGTIADTSSLVFTHNEYYLGLSHDETEALQSQLIGSTLIVVGYSGNDIDVFPIIRSMIQSQQFAKVHVVDQVPLCANQRFQTVEHFIDYHKRPAEEFLCELARMPLPPEAGPRKERVAAIVPCDDKYSAVLFLGDCLLALGLNNDLAFKLFFLTQDIVEEETGDHRQLCISLFAKSHALLGARDNSWGELEYSAGRTLLHSVLANSQLSNHREMLLEFGSSWASLEIEEGVERRYMTSAFMGGGSMPQGLDRFDDSPRSLELLRTIFHWELRTRIRLCFAALAAASNRGCREQERQEMLGVPEKLMYGFRRWRDHFVQSRPGDELPVLPLFYSEYFAAYRAIVTGDKNAVSTLDECIRMAKQGGFYLGIGQCYFLKRKFGFELSTAERQDYIAIQEHCGVDE